MFHLSIPSVVNKYTTLLQSTTNCKKAFPNLPVIAYRLNASLRDLLVHSTLPHENSSRQQPAGIKKCNNPRCLTCSFLRGDETNYVFSYGLRLTHCSFHVGSLHVRMCFFGCISLARVFILRVTEFSLSSYRSSSTSWRWILLF